MISKATENTNFKEKEEKSVWVWRKNKIICSFIHFIVIITISYY